MFKNFLLKTSIVVTTYNRPDALELVIKSILSQKSKPFEVIIADDGSDKSTLELVNRYKNCASTKIIHSWHEDKGFRAARSRNKAISEASGDYIILIDGDMILDSSFVEDHIRNAKPGQFIQGSRVFLTEKITQDLLRGEKFKLNFFSSEISNRKNQIRSRLLSKSFSFQKNNLNGIKTCNMSFFKVDCLNINGFNNEIEGWGREDSEFAARLLNNGISRFNLKFAAIQYHLFHRIESKKSLKNNDLILQNAIRNRILRCESGINEYL